MRRIQILQSRNEEREVDQEGEEKKEQVGQRGEKSWVLCLLRVVSQNAFFLKLTFAHVAVVVGPTKGNAP